MIIISFVSLLRMHDQQYDGRPSLKALPPPPPISHPDWNLEFSQIFHSNASRLVQAHNMFHFT